MATVLLPIWQHAAMPNRTTPISPPPPMDVDPGRRFSLCGQAVVPILAGLASEAQDAGWHQRELVVAVMTWEAARAAMIDGGEAVTEALMLSLDAPRSQGG